MRRVLLTNLLAYDGDVWLITVTAPGVDVLPWSGRRVERHAAHEWNRTAAARWSELHRWASQATRREGYELSSLARVWQMQGRGVLHLHLALGRATERETAGAWFYVRKLRERSREFGFGFVDAVDRDGKSGRSRVLPPHRAAGYLSRYLGESSQLREAIALEERPRRLVWVSPKLSAITGCTRRRLRRARFLWSLRTLGPGALRYAGALPAWLRDADEHERVSSLLRGSVVVAGP